MPETSDSKRHKESVVAKLRSIFPDLRRKGRANKYMFYSKSGDSSFYLTYASNDKLFYDIAEEDLREIESAKNGFFCVLVGNSETSLFFPAGDVRNQLSKFITRTDGTNYKFHLEVSSGKYTMKEIPTLNVMKYFNNFNVKFDIQLHMLLAHFYFWDEYYLRQSLNPEYYIHELRKGLTATRHELIPANGK